MSIMALNSPVIVSISGTTAASAELASGIHEITAEVDCFYLQGTSAVEAAVTDNPLFAGDKITLEVQDPTTSGYIAFITTGATGSAYIKLIEII